jgi:hypothetical protein
MGGQGVARGGQQRYYLWRLIMVGPAIIAIVFGVMLFALGMIPGLIATLMGELQKFQDHFYSRRRPIHNVQTDLQFSAETWLATGGAIVMILGLLALVSS